ncbi:MAG TPA: ATP-binding protein [Dehalococcoidia bacterium]|nr:ATP-binding protein [Dehalococcoidia bacterium]
MPAIYRKQVLGYAAAPAAVALVSLVIALVDKRVHISNISTLYLIAVLALASIFGRGAAILAAGLAFLVFNWFFVEPRYGFRVADPAEWVALLLFLATAVITGQLAAGQRTRAREAALREREAVLLYDLVRLLTESDLELALRGLAQRLRRDLNLAAVVVRVGDGAAVVAEAAVGDPDAIRIAEPLATANLRLMSRGSPPTVTEQGTPGRWIRVAPSRRPWRERGPMSDRLHLVPVKSRDRQVGALLLVRGAAGPAFEAADDRLLSAVAAQLGATVERLRLRQEATEAEILRGANELKSALLHAVSHDLRTPLASIITMAGSLRQRDVAWTERARQESAETIEQEAQRLNRIVGNLLDLSRVEAGSLRPERGWYDLAALVDEVLGRLEAVTARHTLAVDVADHLPPLFLDYVEVDQILSNLIENATKYSPPGAEIQLSAHAINNEVVVEVADRGPGIPADVLPHVFEPFYRAPAVRVRPKGTGLGLAVARGLVEAHGGRIWAANRESGGACFSFTLPLEQAEQAGAASAGRAP